MNGIQPARAAATPPREPSVPAVANESSPTSAGQRSLPTRPGPQPAVPPEWQAVPRPRRGGRAWLAAATAALALLAVAAAIDSWDAQFAMVARARHVLLVAALEAGIPDVGAAVFAALGIALAMHGRRALRPRALNLACVGLSLAMNAMAAGPGWRNAAIWVMPAAVYALASDTLIAVLRAHAIARLAAPGDKPADEVTPLAAASAVILWLLRLLVAPASTLAGARRWILAQTPVPSSAQATSGVPSPTLSGDPPSPGQVVRRRPASSKPGKQDLLIALAAQRHNLGSLPLPQVAGVAAAIAGDIGLHPGTARRVLRAHVMALQAAASRPDEADS